MAMRSGKIMRNPWNKKKKKKDLFLPMPEDIIERILSRLPLKSVLRFRSVCKTWCSLTKTLQFAHKHLSLVTSQSSPSSSLVLFSTSPFCRDYVNLFEDEQSRIISRRINLPLFGYDEYQFLVGSCNGLLCFWNYYRKLIYVCNLAIGKCLPLPNLTFSSLALGFGFDPSTNEFKVVQIFCRENLKLEAQVCTVGSNKLWRVVKGNIPEVFRIRFSPVFYNGSAHWLDQNFGIVSFNFVHETFTSVPKPRSLTCRPQKHLYFIQLGVLENCLYLSDSGFKDRCEIWVMKDYKVEESWTKLYVIRKAALVREILLKIKPLHGIYEIIPFYFRKDGELLLVCNGEGYVISFNFETGKATLLSDGELSSSTQRKLANWTFSYIPSLLPLKPAYYL